VSGADGLVLVFGRRGEAQVIGIGDGSTEWRGRVSDGSVGSKAACSAGIAWFGTTAPIAKLVGFDLTARTVVTEINLGADDAVNDILVDASGHAGVVVVVWYVHHGGGSYHWSWRAFEADGARVELIDSIDHAATHAVFDLAVLGRAGTAVVASGGDDSRIWRYRARRRQ
jgi:hypothetical protein